MHNGLQLQYSTPSVKPVSFGQASVLLPPSGILPMHNHPGPTLPQETQRKWNVLANIGVGLSIIGSIFLALSSIPRFQQYLQRNLPGQIWRWLARPGKSKNMKEGLIHRGWQFVGIAGAIQTVNRYETAANTNQPSKVIGALLDTGQMLLYLFSHQWWVQALTLVKGAFTYAGEKNDIENSNHPDKRREWDLSRIVQPLLKGEFNKLPNEIGSALRFVGGDIKSTLTRDHWRSLTNAIHYQKNDWATPQSYQSALGTQASLISLVAVTLTKVCSGLPALITMPVKWIMDATNIIGSTLPQVPTFVRALENRDQIDGKLVLLGSPLIILGRLFQTSDRQLNVFGGLNVQTLGGLNPVGNSIKGKGLALNSQKYLALLNQMRAIQMMTERDPYITATTILNILTTSPDLMSRLKLQLGRPRVEFLIQLLQQAQAENRKTGISLNQFLTPILEVQDHDEIAHYKDRVV